MYYNWIFNKMILLIFQLIDICLSQSCGPRISPRLLMEIPCDMSKSSFCTLPGSAYPWSSVRRYIYENQGFMKRMYGEQRQSLILKEEIDELREKYDSIYFYGSGRDRGRTVYGSGPSQPSFGPRSAFIDDNYQQTSSSTTVSLGNNTGVERDTNKPNQNQSLNAVNETESKTLGREQTDEEEHTFGMDNQDDINLSTTTLNPNHETNDIPNVTPNIEFYISSISQQTSSSTTTTESSYSDEQTPPKKGVNACPIKEEVIMPYWANNTRGETLALLNVYPFEQYIHWEKCAYENSQMFCRDGCRCEQQYRLHRLLAFDPKNDCRGIFSDWFRFPGCCVCICYDLPESLRVNRRKARL